MQAGASAEEPSMEQRRHHASRAIIENCNIRLIGGGLEMRLAVNRENRSAFSLMVSLWYHRDFYKAGNRNVTSIFSMVGATGFEPATT